MGFTDRNFFWWFDTTTYWRNFYTCKWLARKYTELGRLKTIKQITRCTFSYPQAGWERLQLPEQSPEFNGWLGLCCWPAGIRSPHVARLPWKQVTASWFYLERNGEDNDPNSRFSHGVQLVYHHCEWVCLLYFTTTGGWPVCFSNNWRPGSSLSFHHTSAGCKFSPFHTSGRLPLSLRLSTLTLMFVISSFGFSSVHVIFSRPWKKQDMISGPSSCVGGWAKTPFLYRSMRMQQVSASFTLNPMVMYCIYL